MEFSVDEVWNEIHHSKSTHFHAAVVIVDAGARARLKLPSENYQGWILTADCEIRSDVIEVFAFNFSLVIR
jgi:hypothetical protein